MNGLGILVHVSLTWHTQLPPTAIEVPSRPCVFSHSNARHVHNNPRNINDEQDPAVAGEGGVIGINGFPLFVSSSPAPSLDEYVDHMALSRRW